ncbi:hypothetical protein GCM10009038_15510 [Salinicola rhizosphaerae]|uniref:Uncharacterized protein n=2 Tax=Salinicola rhizosphaerae TaxID=1443141 RepID=A0ABQ3DVE2_9GAMM|nr:hypothetical protein GCM10009038_15510 [Salinicola rhizosphaerae]
MVSLSAQAGSVTAVDPHTGHRTSLPDNHRDGRPDYVPQRFDVHIVPGIAQPREESRARSSGGGSICHGSDGGTTISTASRSCDPKAPAGDGGRDTHAGSAASTR